MVRVKRGNVAIKRRKILLKLAKGFRGSCSKLFRTVHQQTIKALSYSYKDRQKKKRQFANIWISRLNAVVHFYGIKYSKFKHLLKINYIFLNRKILSQLAVKDRKTLDNLNFIIKKTKEYNGFYS